MSATTEVLQVGVENDNVFLTELGRKNSHNRICIFHISKNVYLRTLSSPAFHSVSVATCKAKSSNSQNY